MSQKRIDAETRVEVVANAVRTASINSAAIDVRDYVLQVGFTLMSSAASSADTLDVVIQDSADGSTGWANVTGAVFSQVTDAADAFETIFVNTEAVKGYLRAVCTVAGGTPSFPFCVSMFGNKQSR